jgi:spore germination cell wall hydrolase CwlJ-like protein
VYSGGAEITMSYLLSSAVAARCLGAIVVASAAAGVASAAEIDASGPDAVIRLDLNATAGVVKLEDAAAASGQPAVMQIGDPADFLGASADAADPLTCLAEAVYYEARSETLAGQRAVAQVVINRTHSGLFPSSVCGVVYQRTHAYSGCQFTFVCDGSMDRAPEARSWDVAQGVAKAALAGFVDKPLEQAMHYHADYVMPYWASTIPRIRQIGRHVFYR